MSDIPPPLPAAEVHALASGPHALDTRLHRPAGPILGGLVVAHPHPAHGGHMDHPVVVLTCERAARRGLLALRFDFRGVRESGGQTTDYLGHLDDWRATTAHVAAQVEDAPLLGAGFSYGARSLAALVRPGRDGGPPVTGLLLLAPATRVPRSKRDFGNLLLGRPLAHASVDGEALKNLSALRLPTQVIVGSDDVVAPHEELRRALAAHGAMQVLAGLNHFFSARTGAGPTDVPKLGAALDLAFDALLADPTG